MKAVLVILLVAGFGAAASSGWAAGTQPDAKIMLHVLPITDLIPGAQVCAGIEPYECTENVKSFRTEAGLSTGDAPYFYVFVIVTDYVNALGVNGLQFGVTYNAALNAGVDVDSWSSCAGGQVADPGWPGSGKGIRLFWDPAGCRHAGTTVAGYFLVEAHTAGTMAVVPWPTSGTLQVVDCDLAVTDLPSSAGGAVGFGGVSGSDPCFTAGSLANKVPTRLSTWGRMKLMYD